jgi:hypothetical protein
MISVSLWILIATFPYRFLNIERVDACERHFVDARITIHRATPVCLNLPIQWRVARLRRNIGQPDHILANSIMSHQAERRSGAGEIGLAVTKHDGVQINSIFIDQAQFGEALR